MYRYRGKGKQQVILLLLLFLVAATQGVWGQKVITVGEGEREAPEDGTYILRGCTGGRLEIYGNVTLIVEGENTLKGKDLGLIATYPSIKVSLGSTVTIQGRGEKAKLFVSGVNSRTASVPGIGGSDQAGGTAKDMGTVNIVGPIYVEAKGVRESSGDPGAPGIGGSTGSSSGNGGTLNLSNGAIVNLDCACRLRKQLPTLSISGYATLYSKTMYSDEILYQKDLKRPVSYDKLEGTKPFEYASFSMGNINGDTYMTTTGYYGGEADSKPYNQIPLYFSSSPSSNEYALIDDIPVPMDKETPHMGAAYKDDQSVYYPFLNTSFTNSITLNITNYPHSGTLIADGQITLSGNNRKLSTAADGLTLQAQNSNILTLSNVTTLATNKAGEKNKLIIDGHVLLTNSSSIASGAAVNISGIAVYNCKTTIQTGNVTGITYGNSPITNYAQQGTDLYLWLPVGNQELRITTDAGIVYTAAVTVTAQESTPTSQPLTVYATEFDISRSSIALATVAGGGQSVTYNTNTYPSPALTPIIITGSATDGKNITLSGGNTANILLNTPVISTTSAPALEISGMANVTVKDNCSLTSSNNPAIQINAGAQATLTGTTAGTDILTASAIAKETHKDINNAGILKVSGGLTLRSQNSTFPPTATIEGSPVIQLWKNSSWVNHYRTNFLTSAVGDATTLESVKLTTSGNPNVSENLYTKNAINKTFYFWMTNPSEAMRLKTATSEYSLTSQTGIVHNKQLIVAPLPVAIGATLYETLEAAFAAAVGGDVITLRTDLTLPASTRATLGLLTAGQTVTLATGSYTLTGTAGCQLSAGNGILKLDVSGRMEGTYALAGSVYTASDGTKLGTFTRDGKTVYRQLVTLPSNVTAGQQLTSQTEGGNPSPVWNDGTNAYLWIPAGAQTITIKETNEPISTITTNLSAHGSTTPVAAWPLLDIQYGNITIAGSTVTYGSKSYSQTVTGLAAGKRFKLSGSSSQYRVTAFGSTFLDLNDLKVTSPTQPALSVTSGTVDILLTGGNNSLTATAADGLNVANGSTLNLSGTGTLTASGSAQDINNLGTMNLSGSLTLKAANSKFKPTATISSGTPTIKLGSNTEPYYRTYVAASSINSATSLSAVVYKQGGAAVSPNLYTSTPDAGNNNNYYFWTSASSGDLRVTTIPAAKYHLSKPTTLAHNTALQSSLLAVSIGSAYYATLKEAFAEAVNGNTVTLNASLTLSVNEVATLSKLTTGQTVTLSLGNYNLTAAAGCQLSAGSGTLKLDVSGSGKMEGTDTYALTGSVYTIADDTKLGKFTRSGGSTIYRQLVSLPTNTPTGQSLTCQVGSTTAYPAWNESGQTCLWVPSGPGQTTTIKVGNEPISTITTNLSAHGNTTPVTAWPLLDIQYGNITIAGSTVTYGSKSYSQTVTGLAAGKRFKLSGVSSQYRVTASGPTFLDLNDLKVISSTQPALSVTSGTVDLLLTGASNSLTATAADGLNVAVGSTLNLSGTGTLTASGSAQDINNLGTMSLSGSLTLKAANSKFKPTATISSGTPIIQLGQAGSNYVAHYRSYFTAAEVGNPASLASVKYKNPDTDVSAELYTGTPSGGNFWFWTPASTRLMQVKTNLSNLIYVVPVQSIDGHGAKLNIGPMPVAIGDNSYESLDAAFAAAVKGNVITLTASLALPANTRARLSRLAANETVTLQTGAYTLTAGSDCQLSAGNGTLTLDISGSGELKGTYSLQGYVYSASDASKLNTASFKQGDVTVFRTMANKLPTGLTGPMTATTADGMQLSAWYDTGAAQACLWLPQAAESTVTLGNVLSTSVEPVATLTAAINGHSTNALPTRPRVDVEYADVTVAATGSNTVVTYGTKRYVATLTDITANNRLPLYGSTTKNQIAISGAATAYLSLRSVNIQTQAGAKPALAVTGPADIELYKSNLLRGGYDALQAFPAMKIGSTLTLRNDAQGTGQLFAYGGRIGGAMQPALLVEGAGKLIVEGGTLLARHGDDTQTNAISGSAPQIKGGSVDALSGTRPTNGTVPVYKVAITTGLEPGQVYTYQYKGKTAQTFPVMPDNDGKIYCWLPAQPASTETAMVTLVHPTTFEKKEIEIVKVDENDSNVAPTVLEMWKNGGPAISFGNLKDAFDAMREGTAERPSVYTLKLLTNINNLRTLQKLPLNTQATLDVGSTNIAAQNGTEVAFDASANGAFLRITGKGNIKNSFRIAGDVFIDGVVPLTDAVVELNKKAVFRTLVKGLPSGKENSYTYSYGQQQNIPFNLHDGQACLWLPDYGRSEELRFVVSGSSGLSTEYTAGNITTVTQRTEAIPANPVGVTARLSYRDSETGPEVSQAFNTLQGAFDEAGKATGKFNTTVSLLTGVSISGTLKASGTFTLNLDGKNITSASGGLLEVADRCRMLIADQTAGMKGALQTDVELKGDGQLFVPSSIQMKGNVKRSGTFLWRTLLNMSSMPTTITKVEYLGNSYPVVAREVCLWLPENNVSNTEYLFTIAGQAEPEKVSGYMIMAHHNNDMIMGSKSTNEARIGTKDEPTLAGAFTHAEDEQTIELLKNIQLTAEIATAKKLKLELGKYTIDPVDPPATEKPIRITGGGQLTIESRTSTGQFRTALLLDGGLLYMGQSMNGNNIGSVTNKADASTPLYRLLVTNLPTAIPPGTFDFTYGEEADKVTGKFIVQGNIACLWLPQSAPRKLTFTVAGGAYETQNVMINADHFNTETYGVSDVAQIRNGNKYSTLTAAFAAASGKTLVLLKNAALTDHITIAGNVILETGNYSIMAQAVGASSATFTVPKGANLQITGKGNITANFNIQPVTMGTGNGNGNLQVEEGVTLNSNILMEKSPVYRTVVKGLPAGIQTVTYIYGSGDKEQKGEVLTAGDGTLYLWIKKLDSTPQNFFVETPTQSYLATSVVITDAHNNPIAVTPVSALAGIGNETFDTLDKAFEAATNGDNILLRKDAPSLTGKHILTNETTGLVTLNLQENTITSAGATFDANKGHLLLTNGSLTGTLSLTDNVYAGGDVMMNNATVSKDSRTVWRTLLALPQVSPIISEFSYKLGEAATTVKCTNIQTIDNRQVACLWLPSSSAAQALTVEAGQKVYTLTNVTIASTHGNELDATDNNPAAAIGEKEYASLASALAAVKAAGETVTLKKDLALSSLQSIKETVTLNMDKHSFTSNYGGFEVNENKTLTLTNGQLLGTIRLPGKGLVNADKSVKIAGIILNKEADEVFRTLVRITDSDTRCLWMIPAEVEQDREIEVTPDTYEVTLPANLSNHNTTLTAYKRLTLTADDATWLDEYANTNLVLQASAIWNVENAPAEGAALHRLTIHDGATVKTGTAQVLATDGIRYIRTFATKEIWQSVALPYTAARITANLTVKDAEGKSVEKLSTIVPASGSGTAGHFWLRTIQSDGSTLNVTTSEMTANMAYIMAVPEALERKPITFISAPNQLLRRDKVLAVKPVKGFAAYANGALDALTIGEPCYILTADGKLFKREATYTLPPFRGYLLADAATTAATPEIRMGVATDVPQITDRSDLRVYTEGRYIILEATCPEPVWIYSLSGYCLRHFITPAGRTAIEAGDGFYLVNRTKVVVRGHY